MAIERQTRPDRPTVDADGNRSPVPPEFQGGLAALRVRGCSYVGGPYSAERHAGKLGSMQTVQLESTITCPVCGHAKSETMTTDACQWFYECGNCKAILRPKHGDCCVFCSYGTVKCPPIQHGSACCSN